MIIDTKKSDVVVSGDVKKSNFSIQASAKAFEILSSNIYSNKIKAVIREVSCNAQDAHVAVSNLNPFDVHLPTSLEPWFNVRDYGPGLSDEDIRYIYTTYFFSTKTESNDYTGALGLGSKSPFCLVDSFIVTSYFNGVKRIYSCYKSETGEPSIALLSEEDTDEPNGLNVYVDVEQDNFRSFIEEAVEVYKYFDKVPNINIQSVYADVKKYKDSLIVATDNIRTNLKRGEMVAVMGNVAYDIPYNYRNIHVDAELLFDIGELSFDPGRENLSMDKKTIEAIERKTNKISEEITSHIEQQIEKEATQFEKFAAAEKFLFNHSGSTKISQKCRDLYNKYEVKPTTKYYHLKVNHRGTVNKDLISGPIPTQGVIFVNKKGYWQRIMQYARKNKQSVVVLTQEQIDEAGIDSKFIQDPANLPKIERTYTAIKKGNVFTYVTTGSSSYWRECDSIPTDQKIFVKISRNQPIGYDNYTLKRKIVALIGLDLLNKDEPIYGVKAAYADTKKFRADKSWVSLDSFVKDSTKIFEDELFLEDFDCSGLLNIAKIVDIEDFKELDRLYKKKQGQSDRLEIFHRLGIAIKKDDSIRILANKIYNRYPMLKFVHDAVYHKAEILEYIAERS